MSTYPNNNKQTIWETWFVFSTILLLSTIFIGTTDNSVKIYPNFPIFFGVVVINMFVATITGVIIRKL